MAPEAAPPHELLGIAPDADAATARRAFFREARRWHPDKQPLDTSPEVLQAAQARFVAVHAAYEKFESGTASAASSDPKVAPPFQAMFEGSREYLKKAQEDLQECEEYLEELHEEALKRNDWGEADLQVLKATWRRAFSAREKLKWRVADAKVKVGYLAALEKPRVPEPEPERTGPLDGPRNMSDDLGERVQRVGNMVGELYDDFLGDYFKAFRATRKGTSSWSFWGGEQLAEA